MTKPNRPPGEPDQKKDFWDKTDIVAKGIIGALTAIVAIVVAIIGGRIQESIANQTTGKDYLAIALGILEQKDLPEQLKKSEGLRTWAVNLLQHYSPENLDKATVDELIKGDTNLPKLTMTETTSAIATANGQFPVTTTQTKDGLRELSLYNSGSIYITDQRTHELVALIKSGIPLANSAILSPDDQYVLVHDTERFSICGLNGGPTVLVKPPSGISWIAFVGSDRVVMADAKGKQTKYDLAGKEVP